MSREIFEEAARRIDKNNDNACCVLDEVARGFWGTAIETVFYGNLYRPDSSSPANAFWMVGYGQDVHPGKHKYQDHRVIMLLFAAEVWEDEHCREIWEL